MMDEMKSALERALERAEGMGRLSPEEMQRQNEARYVPIGEAIAQRFLEHGYVSVMAEQLEKIEAEGKEIAVRAALSELVEGIDLEDNDLIERALSGIIGLRGASDAERVADEIKALRGQYAWQKKLLYEENSAEMGKGIKEWMSAAGISGSAVAGVNLAKDEAWGRKSDELRAEFFSRLQEMKRELRRTLGKP
ncbi:MAG: hypothetical protein R6U37_04695 [Dehalococcoidia bacterium]